MNGNAKHQHRVRLYRSSDREQVFHVYKEAIVNGYNSPRKVALRAKLRSPVAILFYTLILLGLLLPITVGLRNGYLRIMSYLFSYLLAFGYIQNINLLTRKYFVFCELAFQRDMYDIGRHYKTRPPCDGEKSGFWVVECDVDDGDGIKPKVVGCTGLDEASVMDSNSAELRRMAVLPAYQRQGIGSMLVETLIDHARARGLSKVILQVSENQLDAFRLYAKHGWVERSRTSYSVEGLSDMMLEMVLDL